MFTIRLTRYFGLAREVYTLLFIQLKNLTKPQHLLRGLNVHRVIVSSLINFNATAIAKLFLVKKLRVGIHVL